MNLVSCIVLRTLLGSRAFFCCSLRALAHHCQEQAKLLTAILYSTVGPENPSLASHQQSEQLRLRKCTLDVARRNTPNVLADTALHHEQLEGHVRAEDREAIKAATPHTHSYS